MLCLQFIAKHTVYRLMRFLFIFVQDILQTLIGRKRRRSETDCLEVLNVVYRQKLLDIIVASQYDFVWYHDSFQNPKVLMDEHWSLYSIDTKYVYFVYLPKVTREYNVRNAPFMFVKQCKDALKVGRLHLTDFARLGQELSKPKGTLVFVPSAARSGSTLAVSILQCHDHMSVYGVNDVFTGLGLMETENVLTKDMRTNLLIACLKFFCRNQTAEDTTVLKPRGIVMTFVPTISELMPEVKMFYIFRRDTKKVLQSVYKMRKDVYGDNVSLQIAKYCEPLAVWIFGDWFVNGCKSWSRFGKRDTWDFVLNMHILNYAGYFKNRPYFHIDWVVYEEVLTKPLETMVPVFKLCKIKREFWENAISSALQHDSQDGTALSMKKMAVVNVDKALDNQMIEKIRYMCKTLEVPEIPMLDGARMVAAKA